MKELVIVSDKPRVVVFKRWPDGPVMINSNLVSHLTGGLMKCNSPKDVPYTYIHLVGGEKAQVLGTVEAVTIDIFGTRGVKAKCW